MSDRLARLSGAIMLFSIVGGLQYVSPDWKEGRSCEEIQRYLSGVTVEISALNEQSRSGCDQPTK